MVKASLKLPNGTTVDIDGTPRDVRELLELYGGKGALSKAKTCGGGGKAPKAEESREVDLNQIVTLAKDSDEAEAIEKQILDRAAQVDRTLLPLYIVHEYLDDEFGLTSGDVNKVTTDLGIPISVSNASRTLSGAAAKYVIGDKVKVKGRAVRYKLSRRGVKYIKAVLAGSADA